MKTSVDAWPGKSRKGGSVPIGRIISEDPINYTNIANL